MYLDTCPIAGQGVNEWLITVAYRLHRKPFCYTDEYIFECLRKGSAACGRKVSDGEMSRAIERSHPDTFNTSTASTATTGHSEWLPERDDALTKEASAQAANAVHQIRRRPEVKDLESLTLPQILPHLFQPTEWLGFDYDKKQAFAARLQDHDKRLIDYPPQFMLPSPLLGPDGITKDGNPNPRAWSNVGRRRYLVIDFDDGWSQGAQSARILWLLARTSDGQKQWKQWNLIRLAMVLYSGKKSLHSWWYVEQLQEDAIKAFFCLAYRIYADKATYGEGQLVRTPTAIRKETGMKQDLLYLANIL
jgi:hypothetical protein